MRYGIGRHVQPFENADGIADLKFMSVGIYVKITAHHIYAGIACGAGTERLAVIQNIIHCFNPILMNIGVIMLISAVGENNIRLESFAVAYAAAKPRNVDFLLRFLVRFRLIDPSVGGIFKHNGIRKEILIFGRGDAVIRYHGEVQTFTESNRIAFLKRRSRFRIKPKHIASHVDVEKRVFAGLAVIEKVVPHFVRIVDVGSVARSALEIEIHA